MSNSQVLSIIDQLDDLTDFIKCHCELVIDSKEHSVLYPVFKQLRVEVNILRDKAQALMLE